MSSYVIGLTGGIACGKSTLSAALKKAGAHVIDADEISRSLTAENGEALPLIRQAFGDGVFEGSVLNRRALAGAVFGCPEKLDQLNQIMHPLVLSRVREEIEGFSGVSVLDVPLLYECGMEAWCDEVWCAYVPQKEQLIRLRERDHMTRKEALQRIRAQMPALKKARLSRQIIRTDRNFEESAEAVLKLWEETLSRIEKEKTLE